VDAPARFIRGACEIGAGINVEIQGDVHALSSHGDDGGAICDVFDGPSLFLDTAGDLGGREERFAGAHVAQAHLLQR
jgi:hypothetical protein